MQLASDWLLWLLHNHPIHFNVEGTPGATASCRPPPPRSCLVSPNTVTHVRVNHEYLFRTLFHDSLLLRSHDDLSPHSSFPKCQRKERSSNSKSHNDKRSSSIDRPQRDHHFSISHSRSVKSFMSSTTYLALLRHLRMRWLSQKGT